MLKLRFNLFPYVKLNRGTLQHFVKLFQSLGHSCFGYTQDLPNRLHREFISVAEGQEITIPFIQLSHGSSQIFKQEILQSFRFRRAQMRIATGQHRFENPFTQVPSVLPFLGLLTLSIQLQEVCDLLWH